MWFERPRPVQRVPTWCIVRRMGDELAEAIEYLRDREHVVQQQVASLTADLRKIRSALVELGVEQQQLHWVDAPTTVSDESGSEAREATLTPGVNPGRYGRPVRAIVLDVLESENRAWTSAEVQEAVRDEVGPERVDDKLKATVRTALWTLRKHGQSVTDDSGRHTATKWLTTSTETPAATRVSDAAPTNGQGGEDHAHDHRHSGFGRIGDHQDRTPVGG